MYQNKLEDKYLVSSLEKTSPNSEQHKKSWQDERLRCNLKFDSI